MESGVWREDAILLVARRDPRSGAVIEWIIGTWVLTRQTVSEQPNNEVV
jgi:hypothetical protein